LARLNVADRTRLATPRPRVKEQFMRQLLLLGVSALLFASLVLDEACVQEAWVVALALVAAAMA